MDLTFFPKKECSIINNCWKALRTKHIHNPCFREIKNSLILGDYHKNMSVIEKTFFNGSVWFLMGYAVLINQQDYPLPPLICANGTKILRFVFLQNRSNLLGARYIYVFCIIVLKTTFLMSTSLEKSTIHQNFEVKGKLVAFFGWKKIFWRYQPTCFTKITIENGQAFCKLYFHVLYVCIYVLENPSNKIVYTEFYISLDNVKIYRNNMIVGRQ